MRVFEVADGYRRLDQNKKIIKAILMMKAPFEQCITHPGHTAHSMKDPEAQ